MTLICLSIYWLVNASAQKDHIVFRRSFKAADEHFEVCVHSVGNVAKSVVHCHLTFQSAQSVNWQR